MDDYLKTDMTEFGLTLKSINPSAEWIAIPPEVKWVDADCSMNQLSALKYVEVQDVQVLLSIMYPPKKITPAKMASYTQRTKRNCLNVRLKERDIS